MDFAADRQPPRLPASDWRRTTVFAFVGLAMLTIGAVFWLQDLRYSLPTERPVGLTQAAIGSAVSLPPALAAIAEPGKPLLLNFYNPDCPCSRFNRDHLQALLHRFGSHVQFVSIVETTRSSADSGLDMPHVNDAAGTIAATLGVYSTPQAVLLDGRHRLLFRGNYNSSRYCTTPQTQFVRLAIEAMLKDDPIVREPGAEIAYGCALPDQECCNDKR